MRTRWLALLMVCCLGFAAIAFAGTPASASVSRPATGQVPSQHIDWCGNWDGMGYVEDYSYFGPLPGTDMPGHGDISIPIRAYTLFGCDAYIFRLNVTWDYDQYQVANVRAGYDFDNLNIQLDLHLDEMTIVIDPPEGGYQATIDALGHVTNNFGLNIGAQVGIDFQTYPHINVTVYPNGGYSVNALW